MDRPEVRPHGKNSAMRVSVIVPVRNEAACIRETLFGLACQEFPAGQYEILVADGASEDGTTTIVRDLRSTIPNLQLVDNPKRLASAGRNTGIEHARGDFVVIVDGHCQVRDRHYLTHLVEAFESSGADCLGRPQPLRADRPTRFQHSVAGARTSWLGHNPDSHIYSAEAGFVPPDNVAVAYRREVFDRVGRFDESFDACEDVEFNTRVRRAGLTCYFTPAIAVEYQPRSTLRGLAYQMMRYGRGRARLARKHPATLSGPSLIPALWLLWLAAATLIGLFWPPVLVALAATVATYLLVVLAESVRLSRTDAGGALAWLPLVFASIHIGFGIGYIRQAVAEIGLPPTRIWRWVTPVRRP